MIAEERPGADRMGGGNQNVDFVCVASQEVKVAGAPSVVIALNPKAR